MLNEIPIQQTTLSNGLTVLLREMHHAPVVSFWVWYRVGSRHEGPGLTGASHWVEHMLFKGTPRFPKGQLDRTVARLGGSFNAMTWLDFTAYYITLPAAKIEIALQIEADRMTQALFEPVEVEAERTVILSELHRNENSPAYRLQREVRASAFQRHPYRHPTIGWEADLERMSRDELLGHYHRHYAPNNAVALAVGDFESDRMLADIQAHFGAIPAAEPPTHPTVEEPLPQAERRVAVRGVEPTPRLVYAYHAPPAAHPDFIPLTVLDTILGGAKGLPTFSSRGNSRTSRLYERFVDSGLALAASSWLVATHDPYLFQIAVTALPSSDRDELERLLDDEVARLSVAPLTEAALERAKKQTRARLALGLESVSSLARGYGLSAMVADTPWIETFLDQVERITRVEVQRVAEQYLRPTCRTVGWYLPDGAV